MTIDEAEEMVTQRLRDMELNEALGALEIKRVDDYEWGWIFDWGPCSEDIIIDGGGPFFANRQSTELVETGSGTNFERIKRQQERISGLRPWWMFW